MRRSRGWIRRLWREEEGVLSAAVRTLLLPAEGFYRLVVSVRNQCYDLGIFSGERPAIPVISVGNLAVGGTGKTPISAWLVSQLSKSGRQAALVIRGYGFDEVGLHTSWNSDSLVVVNARRARGIDQAVAMGADVAILDDGFQHRRVHRDIDIVLLAAEHGLGNALLPRGLFREPIAALVRAHVILVTRKTAKVEKALRLEAEIANVAPWARRGRIHFQISDWTDLEGSLVEAPKGDVLVVTSIAEPESFLDMVQSEGSSSAVAFPFPDHHEFSEDDVLRIGDAAQNRTLVMTEKDAIKLRGFSRALPLSYVLRIRPEWESGREEVMALISDMLGKEN